MTNQILVTLLLGAAAWGAAPSFHVDVTGKGTPVIFIPGFASSGATWDGTVAHMKGAYECHVLTLAGFAGQPAIPAPMLETVRRDLAAYIRDHKLTKPIIVGHSLGGVLALWLASTEPDLVGPLVIVDSLPFLSAVMNPAATEESVKTMAESMRKMYSGPANEQSEKLGEMAVRPMVTKTSDFEMVRGWSKSSDRGAMADAIYEMMTTDLRERLALIRSHAIVIGTWVAYKGYATREQVETNFKLQYAKLKDYRLVLTDTARHFVMLDEPEWFYRTLDEFLASK